MPFLRYFYKYMPIKSLPENIKAVTVTHSASPVT